MVAKLKKKTTVKVDGVKTWKRFEQLVHAIEERLSQRGAIVTLDDKNVWDKSAEIFRQVDCTIRYKAKSEEVLIAIECRDRKYKQDVQWVDALVGKKKDINANLMIGVSSIGFTESAMRKARNNGIYLRIMKDTTPENLLERYKIEATEYRYILDVVDFSFRPMKIEIKDYISNLPPNIDNNKPLMYIPELKKVLSLKEWFILALEKVKIPVDVKYDRAEYEITFPINGGHIQTPFGLAEILKIKLDFRVISENRELFNPRKHTYSDTQKGKISDIISIDYISFEKEIKTHFLFVPNTTQK